MGTNLVRHLSIREGLEKSQAKIIPLIAHTGKSQQLQHIGSDTESLLLIMRLIQMCKVQRAVCFCSVQG